MKYAFIDSIQVYLNSKYNCDRIFKVFAFSFLRLISETRRILQRVNFTYSIALFLNCLKIIIITSVSYIRVS